MGEVFHLSIAVFVADALHIQLDRLCLFVTACLDHARLVSYKDSTTQTTPLIHRAS